MVSGERMSRDGDGGSCGSNLVLAYYLTGGYGSGHATRALEVVRHLVAAGHDVHVVTAAPEFEVTNDIEPRRIHIRWVDQVVLDSVTVLPDDAFSSQAMVPKSSILKREAAWLKSIGAVIVMVHPWTVDESAADMSRPMGNVDCDEGVCGREDISYAAHMDRQMGNAFFDWETPQGLRGREQTPSPKARSKRSRSSSLPLSPTPVKGAHQKRSSSSPPSADRTNRVSEPYSKADDMSEDITPAPMMNHDVDSAGALIGAYGAAGATSRTPSPHSTKDMSEVITPASMMNHDVDSAGVPIGAYGAAAASTSKTPSPHSTKVALVPMGIFWDIENCKVPWGTKAQDVSINIRNALSTIRDVDTTAVIQSYGRPAKSTVEGLESTGVAHFGSTNKKKNSADKLIWAHLFKFTYDHRAPAFILLITGDGDFAPVVELLETRGYTVLIALPPEGTTSPSLFDAGRNTCDWESMARGDGIVFRMPVPANIETLKAEMIQLYQSKNGHVDMGRIPSEYNKMFNKQLKLSAYNANKLVDLFQKMGDPFSIIEKKIFFTPPSTSLSAPASSHGMETATSVPVPPCVVDLQNHLSMDPRITEEDLDFEDSDSGDAIPSVRRNRWDETLTPGRMADADADSMPADRGASPGATPRRARDATPKLPGGFTPIPGKKHRSRWDEMPGDFKCNQ